MSQAAQAETVETVLGPVPASSLGATLMHEHVILLDRDVVRNWPESFDREAVVDAARAELGALPGHGISTIVDMTIVGLNRDVELLREVVAGTGLNVVVATGFYTFDDVSRYFRNRVAGPSGTDPLVECFVRDIEEGIAGTGVRAALVKFASGRHGMTSDVVRVARAVARAHRATGKMLTTHATPGTHQGLDHQALLREEGVDLGRVVIGHCGNTTDLAYLRALMSAGSTISMDTFGRPTPLTDDARVDVVRQLVDDGYAGRIVLSHDTSAYTHSYPPAYRAEVMPEWRYEHVPRRIVPKLRAVGVAEADIQRMLVDNPRQLLAGGPPY